MATTANHSSAPVKRACDSCHRRKVKCIGEGTKPCKNCISAGLTCTYNAIPQKKGPKGSRAKVLSELRERQRQSQVQQQQQQQQQLAAQHQTSTTPSYFNSPFGSSPQDRDGYLAGYGPSRTVSPAWTKTLGLLPSEVAVACVDYFFNNLYSLQPILHRGQTHQYIVNMDTSVEAYCIIGSLCAYMMIQTNMILPQGLSPSSQSGTFASNLPYGQLLLEETTRLRKSYDYVENPSLTSIVTSYFLFSSYFCLDKQNTAYYYLREASTHAHLMGLNDEETYIKSSDPIHQSRGRRLFWLLYIAERTYALHEHRPLSLQTTISLPALDEDPTETIPISSFLRLINLYKPLDDIFFHLWNKVGGAPCLPSWLLSLQTQLSDALPAYSFEIPEAQAVYLRTSQSWLKTMVWQLSVSQGLISSVANENAMGFNYPIETSRNLIATLGHFPLQAMDVHGVSLTEKLFDIACTLTDVISVLPIEANAFEPSPRDCLRSFLNLIYTLRGGKSRFLPLLTAKINEAIPDFQVGSALSTVSLRHSSTSDIYDGSSSEANSYDSPPNLLSAPVRTGSATMTSTSPNQQHPGEAGGAARKDLQPLHWRWNQSSGSSRNDSLVDAKATGPSPIPPTATPHSHSHAHYTSQHSGYPAYSTNLPYGVDGVAVATAGVAGVGVGSSTTPPGLGLHNLYGVPQTHQGHMSSFSE